MGWNDGRITASHATGNANGGGSGDSVGGLVGHNENSGRITASYATGNANGDGIVGGLVGFDNGGRITACYATGNADGDDGNLDNVGGLVGFNNGGMITASYATGDANGGGGNKDEVGGLVGNNGSAIIASYATGNANGGDGDRDVVGGLVGFNNGGRIMASYGFGMTNGGETAGIDRSSDASPATGAGAVTNVSALTMMNSSTDTTNRWPTRVWDFGTSQPPVLRWITGFDSSGATDLLKYPCDEALLPDGQRCDDTIPGQSR